ncbi:MAG: hypothetical protein KIS92_24605 [Planctomycetota bacterium]|nr:hypothetical protein [Planctomycetota bacterium]
MIKRHRIAAAALAALSLGAMGCSSTKYAERKVNEPFADSTFSGFGDQNGKDSERKTAKYDPISDDTAPVKAVDTLVEQLQSPERHVAIPAEDELRYWATKQGVPAVIVDKVRPLLKHPRIEVRAPALRLTIAFGQKRSLGDLIEVLEDTEYGMRSTAFKALKAKASYDFGYNPAGGELARAQSIEKWRQWFKEETNPEKAKTPEDPLQETVEPQKSAKAAPMEAAPASNFLPPREDPQPAGVDTAKANGPNEVVLPAPRGPEETR